MIYELMQKRINEMNEFIKRRFGTTLKGRFFINQQEKVFLGSRLITSADMSRLNIERVGLYIGRFEKDGFRLSIEGAQILGSKAVKNTLTIADDYVFEWVRGIDLSLSTDLRGYVIIKSLEGDVLGCGKAVENKILNFVPKPRRIISLKKEPG